MRKWSTMLAVSLAVLAGVFAGQAQAADWIAASSYADAESKWTGETAAYDSSTSSYASDSSSRVGWGAVLKLNYATPVNSDRVRISTDFGYGVVDKVRLTVTYSDSSTTSTDYDGAVVLDVTASTLTFTKGLVKSVEISYHYLAAGWIWWLYDIQLYQCPDAPAPLSGSTLDPTSVNATSAVMHGKVVSNGGAPCYGRFAFWVSADNKYYSPWRSDLGNNQEFTVALNGLDQNVGYSYQVQLAPSATPTAEQIVTCAPVKTFTTVKVDENSAEEWVSPGSAWADTGTWENVDQAMDDDTAIGARFYHQINGEGWSPYIHLSTDLQANGIRLWVPGANTDQIGIDIYKDGAWVSLYQGVFTGDTWQQFPFEKGHVTEAKVRLHASAGNAGFYWNLMEVDFHQKSELRTTRYFVGAGAWNNAANWSATSGGAGGASVPGTGCVAIFDANSPSCTLSAPVSVEVLRLDAGFTGVLDAGANAITIERNRGFGELRVAGGELKLGSATHTIKDNFRFTGGTITPGTSTVGFLAPSDGSDEVAGNLVLNNVRFYHSNSGSNHKALAISGTVTANGSLAIEGYDAGGWDLYLNGGEIVAKGAITGNGKVVRGTSNLTISGDVGDQTQTGLFWGTSGTYTVNKPAGKLIFGANEKFGDPTMNGNAQTKLVLTSEVDASSAQQTVWLCGYGYGGVKITGDLTVYNANFYRVSGTGTSVYDLSGCHLTVLNNLDLNIPGDGGWHVNVAPGTVISCKGNVTATNVIAANWAGATFVVGGSGNQSIALGGLPVSTVSVEKTGGTVSFPDGITSAAITLSAGSSVIFGAGKTVQATSIYWRGAEGQPIVLRSSAAGQRWLLNLPSRYSMDDGYLEWIDVQDSDASLGEPVVVAVAGTDSGNNIWWEFLQPVDVNISTPATSAVSPAWVEGTVSPNVTQLNVSVNGTSTFAATQDARTKWFANNSTNSAMGVVLSATQATDVSVTGQTTTGRANTATASIVWTATDLRGKTASTDSVAIRKGDSLLLTAAGSEGEQVLTMDADGDGAYEFTGVPGDQVVSTFDTAGVVTVSAKIDGSVVGSLRVIVMSVDLHGPIACQVGYQRTKDVIVSPASEVNRLSFVPADPFYLQVSMSQSLGTGARINLKPLGRGRIFLQARIGGADGPIVARQEIDEFTTDQPARVGAVFGLKSGVGQSRLVMRPFVPGVRFRFVMFSSGATFNGGLTQFYTYTSEDFTQIYDSATNEIVGVYSFMIELPSSCTSYCFTAYPEQTGSGWVEVGPTNSSNGDVTRVGVDLDVDANNDGVIDVDDPQEDALKLTRGKSLRLGESRTELILRYGKLKEDDLIELTFEEGKEKLAVYDSATAGVIQLDKDIQFANPPDRSGRLSLWMKPLAAGKVILKATYRDYDTRMEKSSDRVLITIMADAGLYVVPGQSSIQVDASIMLTAFENSGVSDTPQTLAAKWTPHSGAEKIEITHGYNVVGGQWVQQSFNPNGTFVAIDVKGLSSGQAQVQASDQTGQRTAVGDINITRIEFVIPDSTYDGGANPDALPAATDFVGISDPRPTVTLKAIGASDVVINAETAAIVLEGYVRDAVADNMPAGAGADIATVDVFVDDAQNPTVEGQTVSRVSEGANDPDMPSSGFWRQHPYLGRLGPISVDIPLTEGTHTIRVKTSENAAGNSGYSDVAVNLEKRYIPGGTSGGGSALVANIHVPTALSPVATDTIRLYYGDRGPLDTDTILTERHITARFLRTWGIAGTGNAQFNAPADVAVDASGNVYALDSGNARVQKFSKSGAFILAWGATGSANGQFNQPKGIAVGPDGSVYVADTGNHRIQKFTTAGAFVCKMGSQGTGEGNYVQPVDVAVDAAGNIYVVDQGNSRVQKLGPDGAFSLQWGTAGQGDGQFGSPYGIAVNTQGHVLVVDQANHRVQEFTGVGSYVRQWGSLGRGYGELAWPSSIAVDAVGNVYICDAGNARIQAFSADGISLGCWGSYGGIEGAMIPSPGGIAFDGKGSLVVADGGNNRVQVFAVETASLTLKATLDAPAIAAYCPTDAAVDGARNVYVLDSDNARVLKYDEAGHLVLSWGTVGNGDGQFNAPRGLGVDSSGNVYVADTENHRIQKFGSNGALVSKWGSQGSGDGQFDGPADVAIASNGSVLVADKNNHRIQKFQADGTFVAKWGTLGAGDGQFNGPTGVCAVPSGCIIVADTGNHRIQRFSSTGSFEKCLGSQGNQPGELNGPAQVAADDLGRVYVCDQGNSRIQRFSADGNLETSYNGGLDILSGGGVAVDGQGNVYVADSGNGRTLKLLCSEAAMTFYGSISGARIVVRLTGISGFRDQQIDSLAASVTYSYADGGTNSLSANFVETSASSRLFRANLQVIAGPTGDPQCWAVNRVVMRGGSGEGTFHPFTLRAANAPCYSTARFVVANATDRPFTLEDIDGWWYPKASTTASGAAICIQTGNKVFACQNDSKVELIVSGDSPISGELALMAVAESITLLGAADAKKVLVDIETDGYKTAEVAADTGKGIAVVLNSDYDNDKGTWTEDREISEEIKKEDDLKEMRISLDPKVLDSKGQLLVGCPPYLRLYRDPHKAIPVETAIVGDMQIATWDLSDPQKRKKLTDALDDGPGGTKLLRLCLEGYAPKDARDGKGSVYFYAAYKNTDGSMIAGNTLKVSVIPLRMKYGMSLLDLDVVTIDPKKADDDPNMIPNPAVITIQDNPDRKNVSIFRVLTSEPPTVNTSGKGAPKEIVTDADDEFIEWSIVPRGAAVAQFYKTAGKEDNTGTQAKIYGVRPQNPPIQDGEVDIQVRVKGAAAPFITSRHIVGLEHVVPYRVNQLANQNNAPGFKPKEYAERAKVAAVILRQLGIRLIPDANKLMVAIDQQVSVSIVDADGNKLPIGDPNNKWCTGCWLVEGVPDTDVRVNRTLPYWHPALHNNRPATVGFNIMKILHSGDSNVSTAEGVCVWAPGNQHTSAGNFFVAQPNTTKTLVGEDGKQREMRLSWGPQVWTIDNQQVEKKFVAALIPETNLDGGKSVTFGGIVMAHEVVHGLGLLHRSQDGILPDRVQTSAQIPALDGGRHQWDGNPDNLMWNHDTYELRRLDLDVMQARVARATKDMGW
jgi:hypothetical protein